MMYFRLGWREIRKRPGRAALTLTSVVIGVAAVVAVTISTQSTRSAFDAVYQSVAGRSSLEVAGPFGTTFSESLLPKIDAIAGVQAANPLIQRRSVIFHCDRRVQLVVMGIAPERDREVHDYEIVAGGPLAQANDVLINNDFAKTAGVKLGDEIQMTTRRGLMNFLVAGLYSSQGTATTGQGAVLLMPIRSAQNGFKAPRQLDLIQLVLAPDADVDQVRLEVAKLLPNNVSVERPAARSPMAEETSLSTETGLGMARAFSLLVALFVIANTFLISVTQRRRQFGIMRAIGATRMQVARMVYGQALFLGIAGTIVGSIVGVIFARYLNVAMGSLYETTLPPVKLSVRPFVIAAVVGIGTSLVGAALPARKASRLSPLDAMRDVLPDEIEGTSRWFIASGAGLVLLAAGLMALSAAGWLPTDFAVWSSLVMLAGIVLLLPLALEPLSQLVATILRPWLRVESRLARQQLLRHRARTTLTTGVVFIAISTGIGLATAVIDNVQDVRNWYRKAIVADFFVRAMAPDMATGLAADLPDELDPKIRTVPGIESFESLRLVSIKAGGETAVLFVRDFSDEHELEFDLENSDLPAIRQRLHQGEVVIGSVLATRLKLKVGDDLPVVIGSATHPFRIAAIADDYQAGGLTVYIQRGVAKQLFGIEGIDAYIIKADHNRLEEVRAALQQRCTEYGLLLNSFSDIQKSIDEMMSGVVAGLWSMVVLGFVVAAFGVANTLTMTVLEQTRELGLLRILAMTRAQVRKTIFAQAIMMGLLAIVPGVVAGLGVAYLINEATLSVIGHSIAFKIHPQLILGAAAGALAIVVAAAWLPAERAARLDLPQALRHT